MDAPSFLDALVDLHRTLRTGVLEVRAVEGQAWIYLLRGVPVFSEENSLGETLGRLLVQSGELTEAEYASVIARMTDGLFSSEQLRFGEVAVQLGYLSLDGVSRALEHQMRARLLRCAGWTSPELSFQWDSEAVRAVSHHPVDLPSLVTQALAPLDRAELMALLGARRLHFASRHGTVGELAVRFALSRAERGFIDALDGTRTLIEVFAGVDLELVRRVVTLVVLGELVLSTTPATPHPPASELVGRRRHAEPSADPEGSAGSPAAPPTAPHAPRAEVPVVPGQTPADPARRPSAALRLRRLQAEQAYLKGKESLQAHQFRRAADEFARAEALVPEALEYRLAAAWARFQLLTEPADFAEHRPLLERLVAQALTHDKRMALAHHVQGRLQLAAGDRERARRSLRTALTLDPKDKDAERHLRLL